MNDVEHIKIAVLTSKEAAQKNITKKIEILEAWLRNGIPWEYANNQPLRDDDGCRICIYFPTSLRSFNTWCSSVYTDDTINRVKIIFGITGNGVDTLNKYSSLKSRALGLMQALVQVAESQKETEGPNRITNLEMEIERLNLFIKNQSAKLVEFQRSNLTLSKQISIAERREKGNFDELTKNYKELEGQNARLREEIALLTKQLKKIIPIRDIKSED